MLSRISLYGRCLQPHKCKSIPVTHTFVATYTTPSNSANQSPPSNTRHLPRTPSSQNNTVYRPPQPSANSNANESHTVSLNSDIKKNDVPLSTPPSSHSAANVASLLALERLDMCLYRSLDKDLLWQPPGSKGMYGGQIIGQAVVAAKETIHEDMGGKPPELHSMHAYFLKPGNPKQAVLFTVQPLLEGKSFQSVSVVASQDGIPILHVQASFHHREESPLYFHKPLPLDVPPPESLPPVSILLKEAMNDESVPLKMRLFIKNALESRFPLDVRHVGTTPESFRRSIRTKLRDATEQRPPKSQVWMRALGDVGDDPNMHKCVAAWASDWNLGVMPLRTLGSSFLSPEVTMCCSLDHSMWFNGDFRADEWMLYDLESQQFSGGRGVSTGRIYDRDGNMKIHVTQEALIRVRKDVELPAFDKTKMW
eukprot:CFRG4693T1